MPSEVTTTSASLLWPCRYQDPGTGRQPRLTAPRLGPVAPRQCALPSRAPPCPAAVPSPARSPAWLVSVTDSHSHTCTSDASVFICQDGHGHHADEHGGLHSDEHGGLHHGYGRRRHGHGGRRRLHDDHVVPHRHERVRPVRLLEDQGRRKPRLQHRHPVRGLLPVRGAQVHAGEFVRGPQTRQLRHLPRESQQASRRAQLDRRHVPAAAPGADSAPRRAVLAVLPPHAGLHDVQCVAVLGGPVRRHSRFLCLRLEEAECYGQHRTLPLKAFLYLYLTCGILAR